MASHNRIVNEAAVAQADDSQAWPVPHPKRDPIIKLEDVVGAAEVAAIEHRGQIEFHATGDTGVATEEQDDVARAMAREIDVHHPDQGPVFLLLMGDIIYGPNKSEHYQDRFYRPYRDYLGPGPGFDGVILGIPGNHDGEAKVAADQPSLSAYFQNFCADLGTQPHLAQQAGVKMPHQPGAYWWLNAPFLDLIGLYTNSKENEGMLGANATDTHQKDWLAKTLKAIRQARTAATRKALVFVTHHPPYARAFQVTGLDHGSSPGLQAELDAACNKAKIWPDVVLSGHSHTYQRYTRHVTTSAGQVLTIPYVITGTGGITAQKAPAGAGHTRKVEVPPPTGLTKSEVTYDFGLTDKTYGYLRVSASRSSVLISFVRVPTGQTGGQLQTVETTTAHLS
jgi:hypothetical protein